MVPSDMVPKMQSYFDQTLMQRQSLNYGLVEWQDSFGTKKKMVADYSSLLSNPRLRDCVD
jgi:hypothetical protein